jgi:hypothetical protein
VIEGWDDDYKDDAEPLNLPEKLWLALFLFCIFGAMILAGSIR